MRKLFLTALSLVTAVSVVQGQIDYHDISDFVFVPANSDLSFDLETGTFTFDNPAAGRDVGFGFAFNLSEWLYMSDNGENWSLASSSGAVRRFSFGEALDFSQTTTGWLQADNPGDTGTWSGSAAGVTYYLALRNITDSKDAWIGVEYDDLGDKFTIQSFAIAPISENMTAGETSPVPEPAETGAVVATLMAGAMIWRKRRQQVAAAPAAQLSAA